MHEKNKIEPPVLIRRSNSNLESKKFVGSTIPNNNSSFSRFDLRKTVSTINLNEKTPESKMKLPTLKKVAKFSKQSVSAINLDDKTRETKIKFPILKKVEKFPRLTVSAINLEEKFPESKIKFPTLKKVDKFLSKVHIKMSSNHETNDEFQEQKREKKLENLEEIYYPEVKIKRPKLFPEEKNKPLDQTFYWGFQF